MGLLLCGLGGVIVFCELGCALVADDARGYAAAAFGVNFFCMFVWDLV